MIPHSKLTDCDLQSKIKQQEIRFGGNRKLKIYGLLNCKSGKRMNRENKVFFSTEAEAKQQQFRPCGHCMRTAYKDWKNGSI